MAPFIANMTYGMENYKWILYGDDDTVFFIDNVLDLVKDLDHNMPYFISDAIWWPNWSPGMHRLSHSKPDGVLLSIIDVL